MKKRIKTGSEKLIKWAKKNKKKAIIILIAFILVIAAIIFLCVLHFKKKNAELEMTVTEATAETGSISTSIEGDGNLASADAEVISLPEGVSVDTWYVEDGDKVKKGDKIAKLDSDSVTSVLAEVESELDTVEDEISSASSDTESSNLSNQKTQLESMEKSLTEYSSDPVVRATAAGVVTDLATDDDSQENTQSGVTQSSSGSGSYTLSNLSSTGSSTASSAVKKTSGSSFELTADTVELTEDTDTTITDFSGLSITAPVTGSAPQSSLDDTDYFTGEIKWSPADSVFKASTVYTAKISLTPKSGYSFSAADLPEIDGAKVNGSVNESTGIMTLKVTYPATGSKKGGSSSGKGNSSISGGTNGSKAMSGNSINGSSGSASGTSGSYSTSSGSASASSVSSGTDSSSGDIISETDLCSIELSNSMKVSINVDELDITSVEEGQDATVTVEALEKDYEGTVTRVSYEPVSSSSTVKYEVDVTIDSDEDMRIGMSTSVSIQISSAENVVTLPMTALQQDGDEMFVYTEKKSDGSLSGKVTVETGVSDGSTVEITKGLSDGDTVYYTRVSSGESDSEDMSGFGGMGGMGGSGMPDSSGGKPDMPSGSGGNGGPPSGN